MDDRNFELVGFDPDAVVSHFVCPICTNVPLKPVVLGSCQHLFCRGCLALDDRRNDRRDDDAAAAAAGATCPRCRAPRLTPAASVVPGTLLHRIWAEVNVRCFHHARGCDWVGSIAEVDEHGRHCAHDPTEPTDRAAARIPCIHRRRGCRWVGSGFAESRAHVETCRFGPEHFVLPCNHRDRGCRWVGNADEFTRHVESCAFAPAAGDGEAGDA